MSGTSKEFLTVTVSIRCTSDLLTLKRRAGNSMNYSTCILLKRQGRCPSIGPTYNKSLKKWMWRMRGVSCHQMLCKHNNWYFLCKYVRQEKEKIFRWHTYWGTFFSSEKSKTTQEPDSRTGNPLVFTFFFFSFPSCWLGVRKRMKKSR